MFNASYAPLSSDHPEWGTIAVLPWDTDIFGFPVADFKPGDGIAVGQNRDAFSKRLTEWAEENRVELVSVSVSGEDLRWQALCQDLGMRFVDYTLQVVQRTIQRLVLPEARGAVRHAAPEDQAAVEAIAEGAFHYGRYHADARFPRELADKRYRIWLRNAFTSIGKGGQLWVIGEPGHVAGFCHVTVNGTEAHVTIAGVERTRQGATLGFEVIAGAVRELKAAGVQRITTKISGVNSPVANVVSALEGRFSGPQSVFHWHAPNAPHLLPVGSLFDRVEAGVTR